MQPKRPYSAYQMWMYDPAVYARINADKPAGPGGFFKHAAEWWKALPEEEKKPYEDRNEAAMKQWKQAKSDYELLRQGQASLDAEDAPEAAAPAGSTTPGRFDGDSQPVEVIDLDADCA